MKFKKKKLIQNAKTVLANILKEMFRFSNSKLTKYDILKKY